MIEAASDADADGFEQPLVIQVQSTFAHDPLGKLDGRKRPYGGSQAFQNDPGDFATERVMSRRDGARRYRPNVDIRGEEP